MTYISPRVAIWGAFCPPLYTVYNNSRSRKELRAARVCVYTVDNGGGAYTGRPLFPSRRFVFPSQPPRSLPPPPPPPSPSSSTVCVSLYRSRCPPRVLPSLFSSSFSSRPDLSARGAPSDVPGFLRCYRESFRVRLRATDYRNQAIPGSGISNANYNH